tara:strand:- start:708 stop:938 length:231 start_codon:yes stop_codon:yes gene_type:complete
MLKSLIYIVIFFSISSNSFAYLGPGMGGGIIAATLGVVLAIIVGLFGILWFPIKRLIKNKKKEKEKDKSYNQSEND